jgi:hypothetical protein
VTPLCEHIVFTRVLFWLHILFCLQWMATNEQCVSIKFCVKLGKSTTEAIEMLRRAFGEHSLSQTAVFEWHSRFKAGQVSVEDGERSG